MTFNEHGIFALPPAIRKDLLLTPSEWLTQFSAFKNAHVRETILLELCSKHDAESIRCQRAVFNLLHLTWQQTPFLKRATFIDAIKVMLLSVMKAATCRWQARLAILAFIQKLEEKSAVDLNFLYRLITEQTHSELEKDAIVTIVATTFFPMHVDATMNFFRQVLLGEHQQAYVDITLYFDSAREKVLTHYLKSFKIADAKTLIDSTLRRHEYPLSVDTVNLIKYRLLFSLMSTEQRLQVVQELRFLSFSGETSLKLVKMKTFIRFLSEEDVLNSFIQDQDFREKLLPEILKLKTSGQFSFEVKHLVNVLLEKVQQQAQRLLIQLPANDKTKPCIMEALTLLQTVTQTALPVVKLPINNDAIIDTAYIEDEFKVRLQSILVKRQNTIELGRSVKPLLTVSTHESDIALLTKALLELSIEQQTMLFNAIPYVLRSSDACNRQALFTFVDNFLSAGIILEPEAEQCLIKQLLNYLSLTGEQSLKNNTLNLLTRFITQGVDVQSYLPPSPVAELIEVPKGRVRRSRFELGGEDPRHKPSRPEPLNVWLFALNATINAYKNVCPSPEISLHTTI